MNLAGDSLLLYRSRRLLRLGKTRVPLNVTGILERLGISADSAVINRRSRIHDAGFPPEQHPDNAAAPHIGSDVVPDTSSPPSTEGETTTAFNNASVTRSCQKMEGPT